MAKLIDILYEAASSPSHEWGVWAEPNEDGSLEENCQARLGPLCYENGGLEDGWVFLGSSNSIAESFFEWHEGYPNSGVELDHWWVDDFLSFFNEQTS